MTMIDYFFLQATHKSHQPLQIAITRLREKIIKIVFQWIFTRLKKKGRKKERDGQKDMGKKLVSKPNSVLSSGLMYFYVSKKLYIYIYIYIYCLLYLYIYILVNIYICIYHV